MTSVRVSGDPRSGEVRLRFDFDRTIVEMIKATVPADHRGFDPATKAWTVQDPFIAAVIAALRRAGHMVFDVSGAPRPVEHGWADALFDAVGPDRVDAVHRALSRVLHPDVGGTDELMRELNAARDRRRAVA